MKDIISVVSDLLSIVAFFISLFTASKVYRISKNISINKRVKEGNRNKVIGTIGNDFIGGDRTNGKEK